MYEWYEKCVGLYKIYGPLRDVTSRSVYDDWLAPALVKMQLEAALSSCHHHVCMSLLLFARNPCNTTHLQNAR